MGTRSPIVDQFLLIGIQRPDKSDAPAIVNSIVPPPVNSWEPYIIHCFPDLGPKQNRVPIFCFPEDTSTLSTVASSWEVYFTFVFTDENGERQFGFCRRVAAGFSRNKLRRNVSAPSSLADMGNKKIGISASSSSIASLALEEETRNPECICILTKYPWFNFHYKLLEIIEERYLVGLESVKDLITALLLTPIPRENEFFSVRIDNACTPHSVLPMEYDFVRPSSKYAADVSFNALFDSLSVANIIHLLQAIFEEQHIILYSKDLTKVSSCAHACVSLLMPPFNWQSIYIPVLPRVLLDYCMAPVPYLIGVHQSSYRLLKKLPITDVVWVDLDSNHINYPLSESLDEGTYVPFPDPYNRLRIALDGVAANGRKSDTYDNLSIASAFRNWYFQIFGNYNQHVHFKEKDTTGKTIMSLNKEEFFRSQPKAIRKFLFAISATQMFERFIARCEEVHANPNAKNLFTLPDESPRRGGDTQAYYNYGKDKAATFTYSAAEKAKETYSSLKRYVYTTPKPLVFDNMDKIVSELEASSGRESMDKSGGKEKVTKTESSTQLGQSFNEARLIDFDVVDQFTSTSPKIARRLPATLQRRDSQIVEEPIANSSEIPKPSFDWDDVSFVGASSETPISPTGTIYESTPQRDPNTSIDDMLSPSSHDTSTDEVMKPSVSPIYNQPNRTYTSPPYAPGVAQSQMKGGSVNSFFSPMGNQPNQFRSPQDYNAPNGPAQPNSFFSPVQRLMNPISHSWQVMSGWATPQGVNTSTPSGQTTTGQPMMMRQSLSAPTTPARGQEKEAVSPSATPKGLSSLSNLLNDPFFASTKKKDGNNKS
ncbi:hypothetical protein PROFUN_07954 [Planoprotostelium fungivorum]|uniref:UDENN domain-containing protein n=1 Tax=Planoprotostelium fungivorum TaxID=1890364 RepID=A0A2P6NL70_9EUKA|nr:hypothetical protein PROFUN_07954 [Planoprotostelium fungivorum]